KASDSVVPVDRSSGDQVTAPSAVGVAEGAASTTTEPAGRAPIRAVAATTTAATTMATGRGAA
ncbi:MAG TPA: hypothetical protein VK923_04370, partial [Euzebyales bacterium]|nr:hypothetical protein [Euzebyales bacterium]